MLAALCLIPMAIGAWKMSQAGAAPKTPLTAISYGQAVSGATLPERARVENVVAHTHRSWTHNHSIRQTRFRDFYYPLAPAGWTPAQPVKLIELDTTDPDEPPAPYNEFNAPGPREGKIYPLDDDWAAEQLRAAGLNLGDHVMILGREQLHGFEPEPSESDAFFFWIFPAIVVAVIALGMRWSLSSYLTKTYRPSA